MIKFKILFIALISLFTYQGFAQLSAIDQKSDEFALFKASTTYYLLTGDEVFDNEMAAIMKEIWTMTPTASISDAEFKNKIKDKTASFIAPIIIGTETRGYHYLALFNGGKKRIDNYTYDDMLAYCPINYWGSEKALTTCAFRLRNMVQSMILSMELVKKHNIHGNSKKIADELKKLYNAKARNIKNRTLLIKDQTISSKVKEEDIAKFYPFKFEICDKGKIAQAIKDKSTEYYYFQPGITMNKSMFVFDPATGEVMLFDYQMTGMTISKGDLEDVCQMITGKKK
jgi:hypothetical protein